MPSSVEIEQKKISFFFQKKSKSKKIGNVNPGCFLLYFRKKVKKNYFFELRLLSVLKKHCNND